jgi:hypothetical protein
MKTQKAECSGTILQGENTGERVVMLCPIGYDSVGVWTSTGVRFTQVHIRRLHNVFIYSFVRPFIMYSLFRQGHSLFHSEISRKCDPVLPISN